MVRLALLALTLTLSGCHQPPAAREPRSYVRHDPLRPFPEAPQVRLFVATGLNERTNDLIFAKPKGIDLTPEQRRRFEELLFVTTPVNLPPGSEYFSITGCFEPHHFFRYYDRSGRQLGEVAVCFCCDGSRMIPSSRLPLRQDQRFDADYAKLQALIGSWGEPNDIECRPPGTVRSDMG